MPSDKNKNPPGLPKNQDLTKTLTEPFPPGKNDSSLETYQDAHFPPSGEDENQPSSPGGAMIKSFLDWQVQKQLPARGGESEILLIRKNDLVRILKLKDLSDEWV